MWKKFLKFSLIFLAIVAIPIFVIIIVLYINDQYYLNRFITWINEPGNLSAFIVTLGLYFPFVAGIWRIILLIIESLHKSKEYKRDKSKKIIIYDDHNNNYIYYDKEHNILDFQFQAKENVDIDKLINLSLVELKSKISNYKKEQETQKD